MGKLADTGLIQARQPDLYFGQTATIYCVPNEFDYRRNSIGFTFDVWASIESFAAGDNYIERLRKTFTIAGDELLTIKTANTVLFDSIETIALDLLRVGGRGYNLERLFLTSIGKFMLLSAISPDGEHRPDDKFYGAKSDMIVAENNEVIGQTTAFMIEYGKAHDEFLNQMTVSDSFAKK